jgi:hypothetical protein
VQLLNGGNIDEFAILAMLLAGINAIPPLLFIVYCFTKGRALHAAVWLGQLLNATLFISKCRPALNTIAPTCACRKRHVQSSTC